MEKLRGFLWTNWGLMCSLVLFLNQGSSEGGKRGYGNRRGQNPAVGQDLRVPVGQDEQEGNSWEVGVEGRGRLPGKGSAPSLSHTAALFRASENWDFSASSLVCLCLV